ncbi:ABC-2 transporter permease [Paenibacillus sp. 32352]|uniref:ABC-2 transporter permease n=1 Tax=Paenibacillus sp. 32352 TaxID=1969111 RepID=UPI001180462C|nr:ABC-2 transporter permease [Paenibacillus sp. 32352]
MLLNLVKKDSLLVKKYMILMFVAAIILPVFIKMKMEFLASGGFLAFFISTLYILFLTFSSVSMSEFKHKGSALLCATPYGRAAIIQSKYLFLLLLFIGCSILYTVTSWLVPQQMGMLSLSEFAYCFLILTVVFSIMVPVQYRLGFEKARYMFSISIFVVPFIVPVLLKYMQANDISFHWTLPVPAIVQGLLPIVLALAIGMISMTATIRIYEKQNL